MFVSSHLSILFQTKSRSHSSNNSSSHQIHLDQLTRCHHLFRAAVVLDRLDLWVSCRPLIDSEDQAVGRMESRDEDRSDDATVHCSKTALDVDDAVEQPNGIIGRTGENKKKIAQGDRKVPMGAPYGMRR